MFCPGKNPRCSLHFDFRENNGWQRTFALKIFTLLSFHISHETSISIEAVPFILLAFVRDSTKITHHQKLHKPMCPSEGDQANRLPWSKYG
jgi:hypothetical protein